MAEMSSFHNSNKVKTRDSDRGDVNGFVIQSFGLTFVKKVCG
jgi:hypothetical protein